VNNSIQEKSGNIARCVEKFKELLGEVEE